jgi:hypothetical protein
MRPGRPYPIKFARFPASAAPELLDARAMPNAAQMALAP